MRSLALAAIALVAGVSVALAFHGGSTAAVWRSAMAEIPVGDNHRVRVEPVAFSGEAGKPELLVFELRKVEGIDDGLYALEIPRGWQSHPVWHQADTPSHVFRLETLLDLEVRPAAELVGDLPADGTIDRWIEAQRYSPRDCPYLFFRNRNQHLLGGRTEGGRLVTLTEFEWQVRRVLRDPSALVRAAFWTPVTIALDVLPAVLLVLLFRSWRRREPVRIGSMDKVACTALIGGCLATAILIAATGDVRALGWHDVWGGVGVGGEGVTITWLVFVRVLLLVGAAALCLVRWKACPGGSKRLRLALVGASLAQLAIPFGVEMEFGPDVEPAAANPVWFGLLCSWVATVLLARSVLMGVRPLWVILAALLAVVSTFLLELNWAWLTFLSWALAGVG